ncbi:hypothetical protein AO265_38420 [Pseudomonas sp. ABAC61]|nr:hypothetical protein AO265_38420 [Pseudomonas sp. ABAC61]
MALIEIIGDDKKTLIDDEFANMILVRKAEILFPQLGSRYLGSSTTFEWEAADEGYPLVAMHSKFMCSHTRTARSGNKWIFGFTCDPSGVGRTAEIYIMQRPTPVPDAGGLVQLWDAGGNLVFDSNHSYMRVAKPMEMTMNNPTSASVNPDRKYAAIHCKLPYVFAIGPGGRPCGPTTFPVSESQSMCGTSMADPASVTSRSYSYYVRTYCVTTPPTTGTWRTMNGSCLLIDVTDQ